MRFPAAAAAADGSNSGGGGGYRLPPSPQLNVFWPLSFSLLSRWPCVIWEGFS